MSDIVKELTLERYRLKDTNPVRANVVIPMILSESKARAKEAGRDVLEEDVVASAKGYLKKLESTLKSFPDPLILPKDIYDTMVHEVEEVKSFLPKMLTEAETVEAIYAITGRVVAINSSMMPSIMKQLPDNVDKGLASKIIKERIAKETR